MTKEQKLTEVSKRLRKVEIWLRTNDRISYQYEMGEIIGANKGTISKAIIIISFIIPLLDPCAQTVPHVSPK